MVVSMEDSLPKIRVFDIRNIDDIRVEKKDEKIVRKVSKTSSSNDDDEKSINKPSN